MPTPPLPIAEYATPAPRPDRPGLTVGSYLFLFVATALCTSVLVAPVLYVGRLERIFLDFGLKLPLATRILLDVLRGLRAVGAGYWIWAVPAVAPLLLIRVSPRTRSRVFVLAVLLVMLLTVLVVIAVFMPMFTLMEDLSGGRGKR